METYEVRLVVKSYYQHYGIDYDEIFSLMVMLKSIRIMLVIVDIWTMKSDKWM